MKRATCAALLIALCGASTLLASATQDLRIETWRDEDRNTIYLLKNESDRMIEAKVAMLKDCTGNRHKPIIRTFWVPAGGEVKLARAWAGTSCRHDYRVREARYH